MNLKNVFVKITAIFAVIAMIAGNFSLLGTGINAVIAEELKTPEIQADIELSKYVQYDTNGAKGVIVKAKISEAIISLFPSFNSPFFIPSSTISLILLI